jgi:hypothetical protein
MNNIFYDSIKKIFDLIYKFIIVIFETCFIYVVWIFIHTIASNLYTLHCARLGILDIFISTLTINAPHCSAFRWIMNKSSLVMENMWFLLGGYFSLTFLKKINVK